MSRRSSQILASIHSAFTEMPRKWPEENGGFGMNFDWSVIIDLIKGGLDVAKQIIDLLSGLGVFG